jgi:hypothetical protein
MVPLPAARAEAGPAALPASSLARFARERPGTSLVLASLLLAAFSTLWLLLQSPDWFSGYDYVRMHAFYKAYFRDSVLSGRLPLWDPYVGLGRPFLADIETETLYPPNLLVVPLGVPGGIAALVFLHQAFAIYCGARLGRVLGASAAPSLLLGAGLVLASPFAARLATGMIPVYFTLCWWPAMLWLGAGLQDRFTRARAAGFAACVALAALAGNPPIFFVEVLGLVVFILCRMERGGAGWGRTLGNHAALACAGALGICAAAVQLVPFGELARQGNRPLHAAGFAVSNGMPPASWLSLVFPTSQAFGPNWEYDLYCGLVPLLAALGALALWRDRSVRALVGLGLAGALLAAGDRTPVLGWVAQVVPGAAALRLPPRYGIWLATALLALAAVALSRAPRRQLPFAAAGAGVAAAWLLWLGPYVAGASLHPARYLASHLGPLAAASLLLALWLQRARWPRLARPAAIGLGAFCLADWLWAIRLEAPVYSMYGFTTEEKAVRAALGGAGLLASGAAPPRIAFNPGDLCEDAGLTVGFSTYNSYANPALERVWTYLHLAAGVAPSSSDFIRVPQGVGRDTARLDSLNLVAELGHPSRRLELRPPSDPRAYVAFRTREAADWRAAEEDMVARHRFHEEALVERGTAPDFAPAPGPQAGGAEVTRFLPGRVVVHTHASAPAVLVLAEAWYPGWEAQVAGRPARVFPVNGWMRGVVVPAGECEVAFSFRSPTLLAGAWISAVGVLLLLALAIPGRRPPASSA